MCFHVGLTWVPETPSPARFVLSPRTPPRQIVGNGTRAPASPKSPPPSHIRRRGGVRGSGVGGWTAKLSVGNYRRSRQPSPWSHTDLISTMWSAYADCRPCHYLEEDLFRWPDHPSIPPPSSASNPPPYSSPLTPPEES